MDDHQNIAQRIRFDAEDRLPPEYWDRLRESATISSSDQTEQNNFNQPNLKKFNIDDWANAPEFVPRHKQSLANSFGYFNPLSNIQQDNDTSLYNFSDAKNMPYLDQHNPLLETSYDSGVAYSLPPSNTPESITMQSSIPSRCSMPFNIQPGFLPPLQQVNLPMRTNEPFNFVPKGYSANFAAINSGIGPPIAAIVLKKKRKRRPRREKAAMDASHTPSEAGYESLRDIQSLQSTPISENKPNMTVVPDRGAAKSGRILRSMTSEPDLTSLNSGDGSLSSQGAQRILAESCPDLSDNQLELWDDILYKTVMNDTVKTRTKVRKELFDPRTSSSEKSIIGGSKDRSNSPVMRTSIYELCPSSIYEEEENAEPFNLNEKQEFIKLMTTSQHGAFDTAFSSDPSGITKNHSENTPKSIEDSYQMIKKSAEELENLKLKPSAHNSKNFHHLKPIDAQYAVSFDPKTNGYQNVLYNESKGLKPRVEEDYFEGMRIRVNAFEDNDDLTLSESECPQPSRFQQMQWALQRQTEKYVPIEPPERACCSLM